MNFLKKKSFSSIREVDPNTSLTKNLSAFDLILFGLGAIIGTGVFVLTGLIAAKYSGPAVTISYIIAGSTCILVALAYTELAAMLPTSGSIYSYSYAAFGEVFAWLMGSVIIMELGFGSATVAGGWSSYVQGLLVAGGIHIPKDLVNVPANGGIIDLPALLIVLFVGFVLYLGTKDSKRLNAILVMIKMVAIFTFVLFAAPHFDAKNWHNFMPFGTSGVIRGASFLFFAFTGFGVIASTADECKNPKRDLMIGIIGSLVLSTIVYVIVGGLATGIVPYNQLDNAQPLAHALRINNNHIGSAIVATGAVCGMTTVIMMNIYGLSRIFYVISRDGLLPQSLTKLHNRFQSPYITIIIFTLFVALLGSLFPLNTLAQLSSMGALIDYIVVLMIVMIFRVKFASTERPFKCPLVFIIAPIALIACCYLLSKLIVDDNMNLQSAAKLLLYWFGTFFILYILKELFMPKQINGTVN